MTHLSVAIIGAGNIAGGYDEKKRQDETGIYTHAGGYAAHGGFRLDTVYDVDENRASRFCSIWHGRAVATALKDIHSKFHDVISVCTPDHTHFEIVRDILQTGCCRTVFVEKPLATDLDQIDELIRLADAKSIDLVVNFQRRNERFHRQIHEEIKARSDDVLSVSGYYTKGLSHIGVTLLDTLCYLCGYPQGVLAYNRVFNQEVGAYSYEFVLYYPGFSVTVKTTDAERFRYNYHLFEIDIFLRDRRLTLVDISQGLRTSPVTEYAYSGVRVLNEQESEYQATEYKTSMQESISYIHNITTKTIPHRINTPQSSWNNHLIINRVTESYERGMVKLNFEQGLWKR